MPYQLLVRNTHEGGFCILLLSGGRGDYVVAYGDRNMEIFILVTGKAMDRGCLKKKTWQTNIAFPSSRFLKSPFPIPPDQITVPCYFPLHCFPIPYPGNGPPNWWSLEACISYPDRCSVPVNSEDYLMTSGHFHIMCYLKDRRAPPWSKSLLVTKPCRVGIICPGMFSVNVVAISTFF